MTLQKLENKPNKIYAKASWT